MVAEFNSFYTDLLPEIPDNLNIPQFFLDVHHKSRPLRPENCPWLIDDDTGATLGYEQIRIRTYGLANVLSSRWNVGDDDVVAIYSPNNTDYPIIVWAVHRLGAAITSANPAFSADELTYQLTTAKVSLLFAHSSVYSTALAAARASGIPNDRIILIQPQGLPGHKLEDAISEGLRLDPSFTERTLHAGEGKTKIAFYNFSSGTTGKPKAVAIPHYSVIANVLQMSSMYRINDSSLPPELQRWRPGDVALIVLPLYHIYGLIVNLYQSIFNGCSLLIPSRFNFKSMLNSIVKYRVANLFLVPPMIVMLCKNPIVKDYDLSSIRNVMSGAAPLSKELTEQFVRLLPNSNIFQAYGMTETSTAVTMGPLNQKVATYGSAGQLMPGVVARVLKQDGSYGSVGEEGELLVKSPSNASRYSNNEAATKETFIDGWVRTGDIVIIDDSGDVFIVDRAKEIMKVRGFQVAPAELEGHLLNHWFVNDVCVVGVRDEYSGELPFAFVVPDPKALELIKKGKSAEVKLAINKHVSDVKVPYKHLVGGIQFVDSIPKNPSGKLLRRLLRDKANELRAKTVEEEQRLKTKL